MTQWDDQALQARIKTAGQDRYAAGSPDEREVATYRAALLRTLRGEARDRRVLILGMTPELRRLHVDAPVTKRRDHGHPDPFEAGRRLRRFARR